ncbi:MAG: OsmC family protein [Alphaproteobacteria bacterium]|nr:OsmC family protein [Alphaproteobacteria bacterium]
MTTTTLEKPAARRQPVPMNGIDTPALFATIGAVGEKPALAKFQFRANGQWINGTHMRSTMTGFTGAGGAHSHKSAYVADADHPGVLCGSDNAPTPVEYLLHAIAACLTAGIANIAAARGVKLHAVEADVSGDIDLQGILGLSDKVRNGFESIKVDFRIDADAPKEMLEKLVAQSVARSAVFDVLTNGVPVSVGLRA